MTEPEPITSMWSTKVKDLQIAWDATSLQSFMACPRRYQYESIGGWKLAGSRRHLEFGTFFHGALEEWDKARAAGRSKEDATYIAVSWALNKTWIDGKPWNTEDSKKNRMNLIRAVVWYCDEQPETGGVEPYVFPDGTVAVELSFRLPLPHETADGEKMILCGHLDGIAKWGREVFVRERKTTESTLGAYYFDGYAPNVQVDTYDLATYIMFPDLKVSGVMMEAAQCAVEFNRFLRQPLYHTNARREEWLDEILDALVRAEEYAREQFWPMNRAVCGLFGGCPFRDVCKKDVSIRDKFLTTSGKYKQDRWDPLKVR